MRTHLLVAQFRQHDFSSQTLDRFRVWLFKYFKTWDGQERFDAGILRIQQAFHEAQASTLMYTSGLGQRL